MEVAGRGVHEIALPKVQIPTGTTWWSPSLVKLKLF